MVAILNVSLPIKNFMSKSKSRKELDVFNIVYHYSKEVIGGLLLLHRSLKDGLKWNRGNRGEEAMEMVEEGQNQLKILPKQINSQEIAEKGKADRISVLPDSLLIEILSHLPSTKDAIRTGTLRKRWKDVWISVPTLNFILLDHNSRKPDLISFVDETFTRRRQLKLKKFLLYIYIYIYIYYDSGLENKVNDWICYVISCNVEQLTLRLFRSGCESKCQLDQSVYITSCFTHLTLQACVFHPTGAICWKNLRILNISYASLDEHLIENILSVSPQLETMVLDYCHGYRRLDITSKSVKNLVFSGYTDEYEGWFPDIIKINAPNIVSLTIKGRVRLVKLLLLNVSSVVEANLDFFKHEYGGYNETRRQKEEDEMLKGFILNLRHVKVLKIGAYCTKALSRLEAKGFDLPSNMKSFPTLLLTRMMVI